MPTVSELHQGFRHTYLTYDQLVAQLGAWAEAFPDVVRLQSIGQSGEGRELWLLTLGPEPDRARPAVWVDGNCHASELAGTNVALAIAEDVLRIHLGGDPHDLPDHLADIVREVLVHVLPRMSPDGAERVLTTRNYVRSVDRDDRPARNAPRWLKQDLDGDGRSLLLRIPDAGGEFVESPDTPGLMVERRLDDPPPYYKLYPEGLIDPFDGHTIPNPSFLSDNYPDLNRNFPWSWAPDPDQIGAGKFAASEPEARAVVSWTTDNPTLFAWLNLHCFGGVLIRPLGHQPDTKLDPGDLAVFRQIEQWAEELMGYPTVSGFHEFLYEADKPLHGDITDYAFHMRGCVTWCTELWDFFAQVGIARKKRFVETYTQIDREDLERFAAWDAEHNEGRCVQPWVPIDHPQLGQVEVGGIDPIIGVWNPPPERIDELCTANSAHFLRVIALAPRIRVREVARDDLGGGLVRLSVAVENIGYLPTWVMGTVKNVPHNEDIVAELDGTEDARREVGQLDGWGRGRWGATAGIVHTRSRGSGHRKVVSWVIPGDQAVTVRAGSCRMGWVSVDL